MKEGDREARNILIQAKEDANDMIKEMSSSTNRKNLENARNTLNTKIKEISFPPMINNNLPLTDSKNALQAKDIKPNMEVFVTSLGQNGIVLSHVSKSNEVQVQVGNLKMNVSVAFLTLPNKINKNTSSSAVNNTSVSSISKTRMIKSEINVIGLHVEESIFVIDKFLDDASLSKLQTVRIVHGKGTGKLRNRYSSIFKRKSSC